MAENRDVQIGSRFLTTFADQVTPEMIMKKASIGGNWKSRYFVYIRHKMYERVHKTLYQKTKREREKVRREK
jgi:hypothetical protein